MGEISNEVLAERIGNVDEKVEAMKPLFTKVFDKLDALEAFKWKMVGAGTLVGIMLTLIVTLLGGHVGH
jgi:hypothetical protein